MNSVVGGAARSSAFTFIGSVVSAAAGFILSLVLARTLGPAGSGLVFQMISVFTIATAVAKLGLDTTAVWLLPRLNADGRRDLGRAISVLLWGALFGGLLTGAAVWVLAPLLSGGTVELTTLLQAAGWFMPFSSVLVVTLAISRGLGGVRDFVLVGSVGLPVGRLAAVSVATALSASALIAGVAWLAVVALAAVVAALLVAPLVARLERADEDSLSARSLVHKITAFAAPRTVSSVIEQGLLWLDVLIVGLLAGPAAAGVYGVASRLVQAGTIPATSMRIVVAPQFSSLLHRDHLRQLNSLYARTTQWIVLFSVPMYVILVVLPAPVMAVFGAGFVSGATALMIMCIGATVSACTGNVQSLLLMSGRSLWAAINKVIVLAVSITLLLLLVPRHGIVGAAVANAVSISLDAVLAAIQVHRATRVRIAGVAVLTAVLVSALAVAVPALVARWIFGETPLALLVGVIVALGAWGATLFVLRRRFALDRVHGLFSRR